jgi:PAS domain S-box-containing protein
VSRIPRRSGVAAAARTFHGAARDQQGRWRIAVSFSDITERKRAELKRQESEAVLRAFFENGGLYASVIELDGKTVRYVMANRSLTALMGAEGAEGRSTEDLLGRPPTPETMALLRRVAALGRSVTFEHPAETAKGQRWFSATVSPLTPVDGRPRFAAASLDITERRRAEEALRDSEARFRAITEALPQIVWSTLPDGFHDYYNARWYEFTGVPEGSTDGEAWNDVFHPEDQPRARDLWRRSLATGEDYEIEYRLRHNSGAYRWVLGRARAVRDAAGDIVRWMGTCTDIQDIVEAREVLSRSREDLEGEVAARTADRDRMWRHSRDLLAVLGKDGVFRNVSPSWTAMLGYGTNELVGRSVFQFIVGDDAQPTASALTTASSQALTNFENRYAHKDGSVRWISWRTSVEAELIYAYGRDVTAEKAQAARLAQIEEQLRQSQKMEAVGQLTGGIAHDFNNLLQGITGSLDLIGKRVAQGRTGELERFISGAMTSANRAAALTHRLLAFSRRQPLDPRPVKANPLVATMEDLLRRTIGENIELELVLAGGLWLTLCDPNQLESAILNLVINARDAMPDGGKLTVETCNAHLDNAYAATARDVAPGQYVCVCVTDTGTGMTPEVVERAFDPFFTTKPIGQGTGLGLSMIYGFARQSEGYCKIYSEVGQGTTIKLYLPRHRGEAAEEESAPELSEAHAAEAGETVVVIEDEPVVRGLIVEVLHELGYRALEASDGAAGLALVQATPRVDLLITDIGLPGLNGRQVADAARAKRPELKVLFMTGYAENAAFANGFLEPGMSMITKPFAMEMLATRVRDIIEGR